MEDLQDKIIELMDLFDDEQVTTADKIDPPKNPYKEFEERNPMAGGGMLVQPNLDGSRPEYAPKKGHQQETKKLLNWINKNKDTFDFANSSSGDVLKASKVDLGIGTVQKYLSEQGIKTKTAIAKTQDKPKYTKKVLEELREGLPKGISIEETRPGQYYYKIMLKGGKANQPTYRKSMVANEANKKLILEDFNRVSKKYYPGRLTDEEFKKLRLEKKDMTTEEFAKFLDGKNKTTYLGDKWNKRSVSFVQNRLDIGKGTTGPQTVRTFEEAKKIAKTYPGGKLLLKAGASERDILKFVANKISQEKQGLGGKKGFPVGTTKENKMWRNFYNSALKEGGRMQLITEIPRDADGNINWKIKDKDGVHAWKNAKFFDKKTGATYTWGGDYKPGDLAKQVDAAYGQGFFNKSVKVYDEQAAFNKQTFKGRSLNEIFREGLLKKELEIKLDRPLTNSKADQKLLKDFYALRKPNFSFTEAHHIEGVGQNPFRMEVSYRAANRAQNDLLNSFSAGNITKAQYAEGMERLSDTKGGIRYKTDGRFIGTTATPESIVKAAAQDINMKRSQVNAVISSLDNSDQIRLARIGCPGKATGGRIGYFEGQNLTACAIKGAEKIKNDPINLTGGDQQNLRALGKSAKAAMFLKNFLGPAAIAGELIFEGGIAANKFMSEGVPLKQALGESYINKFVLGPKTQIDVEAEREKEFAKGEDFAMAERGRRMRPFMAQSATADAQRLKKREQQMEQAFPTTSPQEIDEILQTKDLTIDDLGMTYPQIQDFIKQDQQMQAIADAGGVANLAKGGRASFKVGSLRKGIQALIDKSVKSTPKDTTPDLDALIKKTLDEDFFDKKDRIIDNINAKIARARAKGLDSQEIGEGQIEFYDDITKSNFRTKTGPFFDYQKRKNKAGGGLLKQAGDRSGAMLESMNPDSQGLPGLLKRVKKQ